MKNNRAQDVYFRRKSVLVTGGSGFVGSHIIEQLLNTGADVRTTYHKHPIPVKADSINKEKADLLKPEDCAGIVGGVDYIFHAAGPVSGAGTGSDEMIYNISVNLSMTANMLQAASAAGVKRFLLFSSSTVYPVLKRAVREEDAWKGPVHPSYFGYGWMRRYFELFGKFVAEKSGMKVLIIRPTAVYGRRDNFSEKTSHVIPALIRKAAEGRTPFVVWGSGEEQRDFLHVTDLALGCLLMMRKGPDSDPVNIGYGKPVKIKNVLDLIISLTRYKGRVIFDKSKPTNIPYRAVDITRARKVLGFAPLVDIKSGLADTILWYMDKIAAGKS